MATLFPVRVAAQRMGVSYSTLKQWIYKGSVRTVLTDGGHHRVSDLEIERLLASTGKAPKVVPKRRKGSVLIAISGRNQLSGIIEEVRSEGLLAQVRMRIGDQVLTAVITSDAVGVLKLKRGQPAVAVIKSTEVMIAREAEQQAP